MNLSFQYIHRRDSNALFNPFSLELGQFLEPEESRVESVIGEIVTKPKDYLYAVVLYNKIWSDDKIVPEYETLNFNLTYLYKTNIKMIAEYRYDIFNEKSRVLLGIVAGI